MGVPVFGQVAPGFEAVAAVFQENFATRGEVGAGCCVYVDGRRVVDLTGGQFAPGADQPYDASTLQLVASATKGALAIAALRLAERGELDLDAPVARYWPEFAAAGKADLPVRWLLSHRAGLPCVDADLSWADLRTWTPLVEALAGQAPLWKPGAAHGYHALTYGSLVGEVCRRVSGLTPGELIRREIADPLGIEFWVGAPEDVIPRVSPLLASVRSPQDPPDAFLQTLADPASLAFRAFFVAAGMLTSLNDPAMWAAQLPAANGISSAAALARMYAACLGEVDGIRLLAPETVRAATTEQSAGIDRVLTYPTRLGLGFQLPFPTRPMAGPGSFGHYGLGGSVGFADTTRGMAFGYVVNQMRAGGQVDPRSTALIAAVLNCLA